jgi:nickel-dependent lactate racemase
VSARRARQALRDGLDADAYAGARVVVAIPDATRPLDLEAALAPTLEALSDVGARAQVVVALGLHRPMTPAEAAPALTICDRHGAPLIQHDAHGEDLVTRSEDVGLADEGDAEEGEARLPAVFHRAVAEAERIVALGTVEPHQYAGFSGGVKTLSIGCAGAETVGALHGLTYLRDPGTALGKVDGNPFRAALRRVAATLAPIDALQVVPGVDPSDGVVFGEAVAAFGEASRVAAAALFAPQEREAAWAALRVPETKAASFYQASRAATYVALVDRPAIARGGWLLVEAGCPEGIGEGAGEVACEEALRRGRDALIGELRSGRTRALSGGEQRAFVIARALERCGIALVGAPPIPALEAVGVPQFGSRAEAVAALGLDPSAGVVWEDVFHAVPRLA